MGILEDWQAGEEPAEAPPPPALRIAGNALSGVATVALIPAAAIMLMATPFLFDAPGSESNRYVWMLAALFCAAPLVLILTAIKARKAARTGSWSTLWLALILPILLAACFWAVIALLDHFCSGNFSCR